MSIDITPSFLAFIAVVIVLILFVDVVYRRWADDRERGR